MREYLMCFFKQKKFSKQKYLLNFQQDNLWEWKYLFFFENISDPPSSYYSRNIFMGGYQQYAGSLFFPWLILNFNVLQSKKCGNFNGKY